MSGKRRAGGPLRQLSLQSSRRQLQENPRLLRRQSSEEWDRGLRVLATSIIGPGEVLEARPLRREAQPALVRPRPVRIAWSERRQVSCQGDVSVGVVVQRVKGLPRPVTCKPTKSSVHQPPESILYSRTQLAERLRLAWRDRQERPNIDIFLARNSLDLAEEAEILSVRDVSTEVEKTAKSSESPKNTFSPLLDIVNTSSDLFVNNSYRPRSECDKSEKRKVSSVLTFPTTTFPLGESTDSERESVIEEKRKPKLTPSITISFDHGTDTDAGNNDNDADDDALPSLPHAANDNLLRPDCFTYAELTKPPEASSQKEVQENKSSAVKEVESPKEPLTATMRRAYFRNSGSNPIMSGTVTVLSTPPLTPNPSTPPAKPILKKPSSPLTRMMSAPASGRSPSPQPQKGVLTRDFSISRPESKTEQRDEPPEYDEDDLAIVQRERIKSAPARRRFKSGRRKGPKGHEDDSSEEEAFEDPPAASKPRHRKRFVERGADIVTMVSLLSPAESEAEETPELVVTLTPEPHWTVRAVTEVESRPQTAGSLTNNLVTTASTAASTTTSTTAATANICLRKLPAKTGIPFNLYCLIKL